ncbi:hypothetical protein JCM3765_002764 [Sporobolomyces pararoseus]
MSTNQSYPSPPSTTSLPDHYSFPPLTGSDPPPTDGPNTRDRLSRGLLPRSGRIKVENKDNELNEERQMFGQRERFEIEGLVGTIGGDGTGLNSWDTRYKTEIGEVELDPYQQDELSFSSSTSSIFIPDDYIDPILQTSITSSSSLSNFAGPPSTLDHTSVPAQENNQEDVFGFYPPPLPPHTTLFDPSLAAPSPLQHHSRIVSNATIIEHEDSSFVGPSGVGEDLNNSVGRGGSLNKSTTSNGLGITREEWLRLGGFTEDENNEVNRKEDPRVEKGDNDVFTSSTNQFSNSTAPIFTLPPPPFPPSPPRSHSKAPSTFILPGPPPPPPVFPPTPIESNWFPSPLVLPPTSSSTFTLPTPPPQFRAPGSRPSTSTSTKSDRRSSPSKSPRKKIQRPTPYPLSSSNGNSSSPRLSDSTPSVLLPFPPKSPNSLRNLTPVTSAVFHSAKTIPIPTSIESTTSPSSSSMTTSPPKKSHSRKTSIGHIPRPRNAFILFRSHIVNSGRIPKTTILKSINPRTGLEEETIKPVDHKNVSKIVGEIWRGLEDREKGEWEKLAEMEKLEHKEKYPDYKYKPKVRGAPRGRAKAGTGKKVIEEIEGEGTTTTMSRKKHRELENDDDKDMREGDLIVEDDNSFGTPPPPHCYPLLNRAQPSFSPGDILVNSPSSNDSSFSTIHQQSPQFYQNLTPTKSMNASRRSIGGIDQTSSSSPVSISSNSPSPSHQYPSRMHHHSHPYTRPSASPTKERHPLSRSQTSSSSTSHSPSPFPSTDHIHQYPPRHFSQAHLGLGITFPPPPVDDSVSAIPQSDAPHESSLNSISIKNRLDQIPLFTGSTDSRQFSLGRWEIRKASRSSNADIQVRGSSSSTSGLMERSLISTSSSSAADLGEEGGNAGGRGQQRISSALVLDPRQFLTDAGLFDNEDCRNNHLLSSDLSSNEVKKEEAKEEEGETFSVWGDDTESVSTYSTAPTTVSSRWSRSGGSQQRQPSSSLCQVGGIGSNSTDLFHFGSTNLFSKPPSALVGRSSSGLFPNPVNSDVSFSQAGGGRGGNDSDQNRNQQQK